MKRRLTRGRAAMGFAALAAVPAALLVALAVPAAEPAALTPQQQEGREVFNSKCIWCHGPNLWGTYNLAHRLGPDHALLEQRTDLVGPFVKSVVRNGLSSMPPLRRTEISDAQLDAVVAYLTRNNPTK